MHYKNTHVKKTYLYLTLTIRDYQIRDMNVIYMIQKIKNDSLHNLNRYRCILLNTLIVYLLHVLQRT